MKKIFIVLVIFAVGFLIFAGAVDFTKYPKLNSCFKASVSKRVLCSKNPDYVQLKNELHPILKESFIKDPDLATPMSVDDSVNHDHYNQALIIPEQAFPFAIELKPEYETQAKLHVSPYYAGNLTNVLDSETQRFALSALQQSDADNLVLYVDVMRLPDRGWLSLVKQCQDNNNVQVFLILLGDAEPDGIMLKRLQNWIELAAQANISAHNITYISNTQ